MKTNSRAYRLAHTERPYDPEQPPEGVRLELGSICRELGISMADMAAAAGISKTAIFDLVDSNRWPTRTDAEQIRAALRRLMAERGGSEEQLACAFHAHVARRPYVPTAPRAPTEPKETDVLLAKQNLSLDAKKAFELFTNPFAGEVESAEQMYANGEIRYVREACWQAAIVADMVAVVGESGSGKSTILTDLMIKIAVDKKPVILIKPSVVGMAESEAKGCTLKQSDILTAIVMTLDPRAKVAQTEQKRTRQAHELLSLSTEAGNKHLLLIEEAHSLPESTLTQLKRLWEKMKFREVKLMLGILLLGHLDLADKLANRHGAAKHSVREVAQRMTVIRLEPLDGDLKPYLQHRARLAGVDLAKLIDDSGIEAIRERMTVQRGDVRTTPVSLVYPLAVNNTVTAALNRAAELGAPLVTRDVVRAI